MSGLIICIIFSLLVPGLQSVHTMPTQRGQPTRVRLKNLSNYDRLGPYKMPVEFGSYSAAAAEVRGFIWEHWTQRRLGYVTVTTRGKEGELSTSFIYIEPDEDGVWHLLTRVERKHIDRRDFSDPEFKGTIEEYGGYKAYEIERIEVPKEGESESMIIPLDEKRDPNSYRLKMKDKDGKEITEL